MVYPLLKHHIPHYMAILGGIRHFKTNPVVNCPEHTWTLHLIGKFVGPTVASFGKMRSKKRSCHMSPAGRSAPAATWPDTLRNVQSSPQRCWRSVAAIAAFHTGIPGVSSGLTYKKIWKTHRFPRIIYKWWLFNIVRLLEGTRTLIAGLKHADVHQLSPLSTMLQISGFPYFETFWDDPSCLVNITYYHLFSSFIVHLICPLISKHRYMCI